MGKATGQQTETYNTLFNAITDSLRLMEQGRTEQAKHLLIKVQQDAEEVFTKSPHF